MVASGRRESDPVRWPRCHWQRARDCEDRLRDFCAVVSMGVFIGQSTRIYDRERDEILYGRVPAGAVVVPGTLPSPNGKYALACAVIVKRVDAQTRAKTSLNELLRNID